MLSVYSGKINIKSYTQSAAFMKLAVPVVFIKQSFCGLI